MTDGMDDGTNASNTTTTEAEENSVLDGSPPAKFIAIEDRNCYLAFNQVDFSNYHKIIDYRYEHRLHLRVAYFLGTETLIIKIQSEGHEEIHANFSCTVIEEAIMMGTSGDERWLLAAKRQKSQHRPPSHHYSEKEKDSSFTNLTTRLQNDSWPVFVIEAGKSESLAHLKADAKWWLENSECKALMVSLIKVNKAQSTIQILKYIPIPNPARYSFRSQPMVLPSLAADILIDISVIPSQAQGGPLTLEFDRLFDRAPNSPAEGDIFLGTQRLGKVGSQHVDKCVTCVS